MRTRVSMLALPFLAVAGCGDNLSPPDQTAALAGADPAVLGRAIAGASGAEAREALELASILPKAGGDHEGTVVVEEVPDGPTRMTRVTFDGYADAERAIDGVIEVIGESSLIADLEVTIDGVTITTSLALACDGRDLCRVAPDSTVEIADLGVATIRGAWRDEPRGGYLTLVGAE